jgi:hypothetical protein
MMRNDRNAVADQVASLQRAKESCSGRLDSWCSERDAGDGERCRPR